MKKIKQSLLLLSATSLLASCSVSGPIMVSNHEIGAKRGEASRKIFLGINFGHTDLGAITAAKKGKITKIATVDAKMQGGMFSKTYSTIVTGQ